MTSGLVQHYDAIDNEGVGVHNPSATLWKDLIGNNTGKLEGNVSWDSDTLKF